MRRWARWIIPLISLLLATSSLAPFSTMLQSFRGAQAQEQSPNDWPMFRGNALRTGASVGAPAIGKPVIRWRFQTGMRVASSPAVVDGTLFAGSDDGYLYALDALTGEQRWRARIGADVLASPAVADGIVIVGSAATTGNMLRALDARTGIERWSIPMRGVIVSSPVIEAGTVYLGIVLPDETGQLVAVDLTSGQRRWLVDLPQSVVASPAIANGRAYVATIEYGADEPNGSILAVDTTTREVVWSVESDGIVASPLLADQRLITADFRGSLDAYDVTSGKLQWTTSVGGAALSSPAFADGVIYVRSSDGYLRAVDAESGTRRWGFAVGPGFSSPVIAGTIVYVGSDDHALYAIDVTDVPKLRWRVGTGDRVESSPAIVDGVVYVGSNDGMIYAIAGDGDSGSLPATPAPATTDQPLWATSDAPNLHWVDWSLVSDRSDTPLIVDGLVVIGGDSILANDQESGRRRWEYMAGAPVDVFAASDGLIFASTTSEAVSGDLPVPTSGLIVAIDAATGHERWRVTTPGHTTATPALVGTMVAYAGDFFLVSIDARSGEEIWRARTDGRALALSGRDDTLVLATGGQGDNGRLAAFASASGAQAWQATLARPIATGVALSESHLFFTDIDGTLHAFSTQDGTEAWSLKIELSHGLHVTPAAISNSVYVTAAGSNGDDGGFAMALDAATGETRWETSLVDRPGSHLAVYNDAVYVPTIERLVVLNATNGDLDWSYMLSAEIDSSISTTGTSVAFRSSRSLFLLTELTPPSAASDKPVSIDRARDVSAATPAAPAMPSPIAGAAAPVQWRFETGNRLAAEPAAAADMLIFTSSDGFLYAVDRSSGTEIWRVRVGEQMSAPRIVNGLVIVVTSSPAETFDATSSAWAFDLNSGAKRWSVRLPGTTRYGPGFAITFWWLSLDQGNFLSGFGWPLSAAVDDRYILVQSQSGQLFSLSRERGDIIWQSEVGVSLAPPHLTGETVYAVGGLSMLVASDAATGQTTWRQDNLLPDAWFPYIVLEPVVRDGILYVSTIEPSLHALDESNGSEIWGTRPDGNPTSMVVTDEAVIIAYAVASDGENDNLIRTIAAHDRTDGAVLWSQSLPSAPSSPEHGEAGLIFLMLDGDAIYAATGNGQLLRIDLQTGDQMGTIDTGLAFTSPLLYVEGTMYIGAQDGAIYAIDLTGMAGQPELATPTP